MFRRKQDVDRHVSSILGRIKDEREKNAKGYQIARLYFEVGEFDTARRYLASFLSVRETVPQSFRLLGQIEEAVGNKENAIEAYKRFLELGGPGKEVVLKICELYSDVGVDAGKGKYWLEKAEKLYPQSDVIFRLKEKLITESPGQSSDGDLESLIASELVKKPQDVELRIKMLRMYLDSQRVEDAYVNAVETDRTTAFTSSLEWYECLLEVFRAYQGEHDSWQDVEFMFHYLVVLCNLTYLRLANKDVVESAEALHSFDIAVHRAINMNNPSEEWDAFVTEMQGQLFFLAGTLLLKRAQKGSVSWNDMRPLAAVLFLLCQTIPTMDAQAVWCVRPTQDREKVYAWLYKNSFFRMSQSGHTLYHLCQGDSGTWGHRLQQQYCTPIGQEKLYEALFPIRDMRSGSAESYVLNTHKFCNTSLSMPPRRQLYDVDRVAHTFHPDRLSEMVWLCLQQYSFGDVHQPDYNFKTFDTLQYSVKNMENGAAETLCQLDTEVFLFAAVRCAALQLKEQQMSVDGDVSRPPMLPLCLCKKLCTPEQEQWWKTAHCFYSNTIKENFSKMRHILQRGIEVVRLVGNHGLSSAMVVHLAKTFDAKRRPCRARMSREELVKSLAEGDHGNRGSVNQLACIESRAAFYWRHALSMLSRLEKNQRGPYVKVRLFDDGDDADLTPAATQEMTQDAKFASATIAMREGRYEDAVKGFERLTTPYASFYRAQIYKSMAQRELEGMGPEETKRQKYTALISQARDALYRTMDHLGGNKNHELNILLTRELDDVESKLNCFEWENENSQREDMEETSVMKTPVKQQNGHGHQNTGSQPHSTPKSPSHTKSVRQRLLLSELTTDSPIQPQPAPVPSPSAHTRPSPERLDAQIKSINYSQSQLFKMVLDRNEELVLMYRGLVDQLQESNAQLKAALGENHTLMEELKGVLTTSKDSMVTVKSELAEAKDAIRQLKDEFQANMAAAAAASNASMLSAQGLAASQMNAAGYFMGSPYQPSQYPPYAQPPHLTPGAGYRYPLLPGYPPRPATPVAPAAAPATARLSEQPGGTAPSSFGKFRGSEHQSAAEVITTTEDEEDDEENGLSGCGSEYGESLLQTPGAQYYVPAATDTAAVADWLPGHTGTGAIGYPAVNPPPSQPPVPQPGYFASALKGQALQYSAASMPGPGFFSTPPASSMGVSSQSAIVTALGGKPGMGQLVGQQPTTPSQPIPVIGAGASKSPQPAFPAAKAGEIQGVAVLFQDFATLTTTSGNTPAVDVRIIQDTVSKQGNIVVRKKDTQEILTSHNIAVIRVAQSFTPNYFLWTVTSAGERKLDETFRLTFDSAEQVKKLRGAIEQVVKSAGLKPPVSPAVSIMPAFGAKSPASQALPHTAAVVSTLPATIRPPAPPQSAAQTGKATFGGFTFSTTPVIKVADPPPSEDKPKASPQFKLKESAIKVSSPSATTVSASSSTTTTTTTPTSSDAPKPFAGFTFTPSKPAVSAFGTAAVVTTPSSAVGVSGSGGSATPQAFVFGQGSTSGSASFASLSTQSAASEAFKPKEGAAGFQASCQPLFAQSGSPVKSPGGKEDEAVEEYEPNVDFKPIIDLPELVENKTGEEDETKVFSDRVKLFRFDTETSQWKERGIGELKILRSAGAAPRFRVIMRREQVLKVCANHYISADMKLTPLSASDRAWCYTAHDFAEEEMKLEKFAVKFKNPDKAGEFKSVFESCQKEVAAGETSADASASAATPKSPDKTDGPKSLAEMFKPEEGSWECTGCYVSNKADVQRCLACQALKPGLKPEDVKPAPKDSPFSSAAPAGTFGGLKIDSGAGGSFGGFKFGEGGAQKSVFGGSSGVSGGGFKFGTSPAPAAAAEQNEKQPSLADMFKPEEGSWECTGCYVSNKADVQRCLACQALKPGLKPEDVKPAPKDSPFSSAAPAGTFGGLKIGGGVAKSDEGKPAPAGGFRFGASPATSDAGGFKFGTPAKPAEMPTTTTTTTKAATPGGFKFSFGTPSSSSVFGTQSTASTAGTPAFGTTTTTTTTTTTVSVTPTTTATAKPPAGFVFGGSKPGAPAAAQTPGFTFGVNTSAAKDTAGFSFAKPQATVPPTEKSEPCSGLLQQLLTTEDQPEKIQTPAQGSVFGTASPATSDSSKPSGFQARLGQMTSPTTETNKDGSQKSGFQFTFSLQKQQQQQNAQPAGPKSPEVDEQGFYLNKEGEDSHIYFEPVVSLPEKVDLKTGEEEEEVLFESRAKLYRFTSGEWKERGLGTIKILQHKETGRIRVLMRREQVLKICCNHFITEELDLKAMSRSEGKAWVWYAMDFSEGEGQMEKFAVRFRDADIANNFKKVFDDSKEKMKTPSKAGAKMLDPTVVNSGGKKAEVSRRLFHQEEVTDEQSVGHIPDNGDVVFLYEETPTPDQVARARKLLLPDTFYLYENRPGCPGCIGCEDYDPSKAPAVQKEKAVAAAATPAAPTQSVKPPAQEETFEKASEGMLFGKSGGMSFSALAATSGETPGFGSKDPSKPFHWAGAGQRLFGAGGGGGAEEVEGEVAPSEDIHFEPVIPLPELVETRTGEEDWTVLFAQRAKVYRFDSSQWKERGIGEMKIMKHTSQLLFRVLLRREQVLKVACNHLISASMELRPMSTSETAWCWVASDFSEDESKMEQFAVKFKKMEVAKEFKAIFEDCQEKLRQGEQNEPVQETMVSSSVQPTGDRGNVRHTQAIDVAVQDTVVSSAQPVMGDKGNPYYSQQLDASEQDSGVSTSQGNKGNNSSFSQARDVASQDAQISSTTTTTFQASAGGGNPLFSQLLSPEEGQEGAEESQIIAPTIGQVHATNKDNTFSSHQVGCTWQVTSTQPGDRCQAHQGILTQQGEKPPVDSGNTRHTLQLDVTGLQDTMTKHDAVSVGDKGNAYYTKQLDVASQDTMTQKHVTPQGDRGNAYYTKQLDVASQDTMTQKHVTPQGDRGNAYYTKQLDVASQDTMTQKHVTPQGDRGNAYYTKQLDVASQDTMTQQNVTLQGDQGNVYYKTQLDVTSQDTMTQESVTPQGDRGNVHYTKQLDVASQDTMTQKHVTPQGDQGNVYYTKQLDVASQDTMTQQNVTPQGDQGNVYYTTQLDVASQDTMTQQSVTPQGDQGNVYYTTQLDVASQDTMTQQSVTPQGDRGNVYYTKQLDVASQDTMTQQSVTPQGDTGNVYYTTQLDVASQDTMTQKNVTPQGDTGNVYYTKQLDVASQDTMTQKNVTPQGDQGNVYYTKQLDVASQDTMTQKNVTPQGDQGNVYYTTQLDVTSQDTMTQQSVTLQGDRGNVYYTKQLDVASQDTMTQQSVTPQGDQGNVYYKTQLDVASQDTMTQESVTPQGDRGNVSYMLQLDVASQDNMTQKNVTPLGDTGNVYYTTQLDVASQDTMTQKHVTPQGDRGNAYYTKQLDVASQDTMTQKHVTPQGDRGNAYYTKQLDVASQDTMTQQSVTPQGDRGNVYYTKQLDVASQDTMTQKHVTPQGDQGNVYYTKQLDVASQDTMTQQSVTPQGDQGNVYYKTQLDVASQDTMTQKNVTPLGDRGNVSYMLQLDVASQDNMTQKNVTPLGDRGNVSYTTQLDVVSQDTMSQKNVTPQGDRGNVYYAVQLDVASQDTMTCKNTQPPGDWGNTCHDQLSETASQNTTVSKQICTPQGTAEKQQSPEAGRKSRQHGNKPGLVFYPGRMEAELLGKAEDQYDDEDYDDDDEDEDEDESTEEDDEEERVEFEKRVTLQRKGANGQWENMGMGNLRVLYDDDLNANKLVMMTDKGEKLCNHVITMELTVAMDEKKKSCEWQPIDFATDEPIRRHFRACFSSSQATEEFATIFRQGQKLAAESDISAKLPEEIEVPEVFSTGDGSEGAVGKK
ncbi:LOW QUALITY PROTEIN: E3 SUMO-protein ligase RanBP2-like [Babylonia areolata]|uniref:LOW QUALITY PROTEIN: E3 SUMO-protein ligase RanBP2-like n=1 Tax=Babylonia areolata TaxID=304850 RepID=UPI003FD02C64